MEQHLARSSYCRGQQKVEDGDVTGYYTAEEGMAYTTIVNQAKTTRPKHKNPSTAQKTGLQIDKFLCSQPASKLQQGTSDIAWTQPTGPERDNLFEYPNEEYATDYEEYNTALEDNESDDDEQFFGLGNNTNEGNEGVSLNGENSLDTMDEEMDPRKELMFQFREYCDKAQNFAPLTDAEVAAIKCLATLRKTKAPLSAYESIMEWHFGCKVSESPEYVSRKTLLPKLIERYNIEREFHGVESIVQLPTTNTCVKVITNDAGTAIRSLLTDPRVSDDDYLFFDNDPFAPPPDNITHLGDLNTGLSYRATYDQRINDPTTEILCPIVLYADGCVTGQFANLKLTQLKLCLGIHNAKARSKEYLWRDIGFIPSVKDCVSRGRRIMLDSGHCDGIMAHQDVLATEGVQNNRKANNLEDYHAIIAHCLKSYKAIQDGIYLDFFTEVSCTKESSLSSTLLLLRRITKKPPSFAGIMVQTLVFRAIVESVLCQPHYLVGHWLIFLPNWSRNFAS